MNTLIKKIVNELKLQIFNEEDLGDKTILAIYPGRFQPMGRHHKTSYDWLAKKFGKENTYIVTSDKTEPKKSPLNFAEKKKIINKHGITNVVKVKSPYFPTELLQKFDPDKTVIVYMIGEKDAGRLGGYKRLMKYNKTTAIPYKDITNPYAYYVYAPHVSLEIPSFGEMSGTNIRKALGDREAKLSELQERFKDIMGWFDASIFNMVIGKMNERRGQVKEAVDEWFRVLSNMSQEQGSLFFDILKKEYGDTKDLLPIIQKFIKTGTLSEREKVMFQKQFKDTMKLLGLGAFAAIPIPGTMLLIPVVINLAKKFNINLLPENTEPVKKELPIVTRQFWDKVFTEIANDERPLLKEGGVAGHMTHPFEDMGLTFGDLKEMFRLGLSGDISVEGSPTEKLDGQNLFVTFRDGNLYAARNKGDIKSGGMDYKSIQTKFAGRGEIEKAFTYAFSDLETAIQALTPKQQGMIFKDGKAWMNLEVMYPGSANVINYDGAYIVFHGVSLYNDSGEKEKDYPTYATILAGMIKQVNANTQRTFSITKPKTLTIGMSQNFSERLNYYLNKITSLQNKMRCTDKDTLGMWHQRWWEKYITKNVKDIGGTIDDSELQGLVKRWAFYDKSFALNPKNIKDSKVLDWAKNLDKTKVSTQVKNNMKPFESLVLRFGAEVLQNVSDVMALNPEKTSERIKQDVESAIKTLSTSTNVEDLKVLDTQLRRIKAAGGINKIAPLEGIVFNFNGKTYKLTGAFAPINQLLGYFKFK
jgi:hypothetical protein